MTNCSSTRTTTCAIPNRFIDTHIHLWDLTGPLSYQWLDVGDDTSLGSLSEVRFPRWDARRYLDDTRHRRPTRVVHVQAADGTDDAVPESIWLAEQARETGMPTALVARAELRNADLGAQLAAQVELGNIRGIRDMSTMGSIGSDLESGLRAIQRSGLSWEAACTWEEMAALGNLAHRFPDVRIVLGHAGFPLNRSEQYFVDWSRAIRSLASQPNVFCKVSGLGMGDQHWSTNSWRPWVETCLEAFSPDRCMFGSNWPLDRIYASYDVVVTSVGQILSGLNDAEWDRFWYGTAADFYKID